MSGRTPPCIRAALVFAAVVAIDGACSSSSTTDEVRLLLLDAPSWRLTEAVDDGAALDALAARDPDLDWFAEYDGPRADAPDGSYTIPHLTTFGHHAGLEQRREQLPGFELADDVVTGRPALVATAASGNPAVLVLELSADHTATLLTYDAGIDLRELAAQLVAVDEDEWNARARSAGNAAEDAGRALT